MKNLNWQKILCFLLLTLVCIWPGTGVAGTIKGTITYDGEVPRIKPVSMDSDPVCITKHTEAVFPPILVLGEGNTMGNVFVYLKTGVPSKNYPVPAEEAVLDQKGCQYHPHVIGVRAGQPVKILNSDGTLHNVHALSKVNPEFNLAMPKFRKEVTKTFDKVEFMFPLKCDVHPWMGAWMSVMDHPFFSTTAEDGKYQIANVPPGTYELAVWHEKLGEKTQSITVSGNEELDLNFTLSRPSRK